MSQVSVVMGPERRRRWRGADRVEILAEAFALGAIVADVSRRLGVATSLIYQWRRQAVGSPGFVPAVIRDEGPERRATASASPVSLKRAQQRTALAALKPNRAAASRRDAPSLTV